MTTLLKEKLLGERYDKYLADANGGRFFGESISQFDRDDLLVVIGYLSKALKEANDAHDRDIEKFLKPMP